MSKFDRLTRKDILDGNLIGKQIGYIQLGGQDEQKPLLLANSDPRIYNGFSDSTPCLQYGRCNKCGINTVCWAKNMICPNCGSKVRGT